MNTRGPEDEISSSIAEMECEQLADFVECFRNECLNNQLPDPHSVLLGISNRLSILLQEYRQCLDTIRNNQGLTYSELRKYLRQVYTYFTALINQHTKKYLGPYQLEIDNVIAIAKMSQLEKNEHVIHLQNMNAVLTFSLQVPNPKISELLATTEETRDEVLEDYEYKLRSFHELIIQKYLFILSPEKIQQTCESIRLIADKCFEHKPRFPLSFNTVLGFIKAHTDFFLLPLNGDGFFAYWASSIDELMEPLSLALEDHLDTPIQFSLFKQALSEYLKSGKKDDNLLIQFLNKPFHLKGLIPYLYRMIQGGQLQTIVGKWREAQNGECFNQYTTLLFHKKLAATEIEFFEMLTGAMDKFPTMILSFNQEKEFNYLYKDLLFKQEMLSRNHHICNTTFFAKNYDELLLVYQQQRQVCKSILIYLATYLDKNLEKHLAKFNGEIENCLAKAKLWQSENESISTITDKLDHLKSLIKPLAKQLDYTEPENENEISNLEDELYCLWLVITAKINLYFNPSMVKEDLQILNFEIDHDFIQEPKFHSGSFLTVIDFIKENADYFSTPFHDKNPLNKGLKQYLCSKDQVHALSMAAKKYAEDGDDKNLFLFLDNDKTDLIRFMKKMIINGSALTLIKKWRHEKNGLHALSIYSSPASAQQHFENENIEKHEAKMHQGST